MVIMPMNDDVVEDITIDDENCEVISMSRIVEIAKGTVAENITEMEMEFAKVLMLGYQMCADDFMKQLEYKIEESVMNMKNKADVNNEIDFEVNVDE